MVRGTILLLIFLVGGFAHGQTSYNVCSPEAQRNVMDDLCPRMEGATLEGCCPQIFKTPPLRCKYSIYSSIRGQNWVGSSYTKCENDVNVTVQCCRKSTYSQTCEKDIIYKDFYARLIHRNSCCFEGCPESDYWRNPPNADPNMQINHKLRTGGITSCSATLPRRNTCAPGTESVPCQSTRRCPVPSPPSPPSTPGPNPPSPPATNPPSTPAPPTPPTPPTPPSPPPAPQDPGLD